MTMTPFFFYLFAAVSILPGVFVLASRDIVRAAFWLLAALSGFAGLYVLLGADFLAVTQVVVYLGGILILILFGVMLTHRDPQLVRRARRLNIVVPGIAGGATLAVATAAAVTRSKFAVLTVSVAAISPGLAPNDGGTPIKIVGANFKNDAHPDDVPQILMGGVALDKVKINAEGTEITGVTGKHEPGIVDIVIATKTRGTATAEKAFYFAQAGVTPAVGPTEGEISIEIEGAPAEGSDKEPFVDVTEVKLGGVALEDVKTPTPRKITGKTGKHAAGLVDLVIRTKDGKFTYPNAFLYAASSSPFLTSSGHGGHGEHGDGHAKAVVRARSEPLSSTSFTGTTRELGTMLVAVDEHGRSYLLPFEIASVLLLAALVGAAYLARRGADSPSEEA